MISEETLKKLLDNTAKIHELAQEDNLKNPRLLMPQEGEYHTLHFMMEFSPGKRKLARDNETLDERLSNLLGCPVKVWEQGGSIITPHDIEEANKVPLSNPHKVTEFFHDYLLPLANEHALPSSLPATLPVYGRTAFWSSSTSALDPVAKEHLSQALDTLGKNPAAWAEFDELYQQKRQQALSEPTPNHNALGKEDSLKLEAAS